MSDTGTVGMEEIQAKVRKFLALQRLLAKFNKKFGTTLGEDYEYVGRVARWRL